MHVFTCAHTHTIRMRRHQFIYQRTLERGEENEERGEGEEEQQRIDRQQQLFNILLFFAVTRLILIR